MSLSKREKAFEDMYANDKELHFKVRARRNKLTGVWAAGQLGKTDDAANSYALELVTSFLHREALFQKIKTDFAIAGVNVSDAEITAKILEFVAESRTYFMNKQ